jgi:hypothetical protein
VHLCALLPARAELELHGASEEAFELIKVAIDGNRRLAQRTMRTGTQVHTVGVGIDPTAADRMVAISYVYRVLLQQHGHLLHRDFPRPTKGLKVHFAYGGCGIRRVNVIDHIASRRQPGLSRLNRPHSTPSIALRFDGWMLPKAGVGFVWVLEREMVPVGAA